MNAEEKERLDLYRSLTDDEAAQMTEEDISDYEALEAKAKAATPAQPAAKEQGPGIGERLMTAFAPRTMAAYDKGAEWPVWDATKDVLSVPGRAAAAGIRAWTGAEKPDYPGFLPVAEAAMKEPGSKSTNLIVNAGETMLKSPMNVLLPAIGPALATPAAVAGKIAQYAPSLAGVLRSVAAPATSRGMALREAAKTGIEATAGGYEGDEFSPGSAAMFALPGLVTGAKSALDAPANAAVAQMTRPYIVESMRGKTKFTPTMMQANPILKDLGEFERSFFMPSEYAGTPAPLSLVAPDSPDPWNDVLQGMIARDAGIAERQATARTAPEFREKVPSREVLQDVADAPMRDYVAGDLERPQLAQAQNAQFLPFQMVMDEVSQGFRRKNPTDERVMRDVMDYITSGKQGPLSAAEGAPVAINDLIDLKRRLSKLAYSEGQYRTPETNAKAEAYMRGYKAVNDLIRKNLPETEGTRVYLQGEQEFAKSIPFKKAVQKRAALITNQDRSQTELGRIGMALESSQKPMARAVQMFARPMPPKVDVRNAYPLYLEAPVVSEAARVASELGGNAYGGAISPLVRTWFPNLMDKALEAP